MKKTLLFAAAFALAAAAVACDSGDQKADLRWNNRSAQMVQDVEWVAESGTDQTWEGQYEDQESTEYKGVNKLTGSGECLDAYGSSSQIVLDGGEMAASLVEDEANDLTINTLQAKKK